MVSLWNKLRNSNCKDCNLYKTAQSVCLIGAGPYPSEIMVIGEAPGFREDDIQKPFAGKAGKLLDIILEENGIDRKEVYITNVVHCRPPENRKPSMDEMRSCRKYLLKEIKAVDPSTIILLGDTAVKGLFDTNLMSISKERGKVLSWEGRKVIVTYHPAAALRNQYFLKIILEDLHRGLSLGEKTQKVIGKYREVNNVNKSSIKEYLLKHEIIAVDLETSGLDYNDPKEKLISINTSIKPHESFVWPAKYISDIKDILSNKSLVINHNIKFDLQWLHRYGINIKSKIFDTMVAKHLLDENYPDKGLKHLSSVDLGMQDLSDWAKKIEVYRKENREIPWKDLVEYGARDSDATIQLYHRYKFELEKENLAELMKTEMKVLKTLTRMEIFGAKIDIKVHSRLVIEYKNKIVNNSKAIYKMVGAEFNLNSPKQLAGLLYDSYKFPVVKKTPAGTPSCDEATLKILSSIPKLEEHPKKVLNLIMEYRNVMKLYSVYLDGLVKNGYLKKDNKIHCDYKICGTKTGRLSCSEPNLQNIPRNGDIKKMFVSSFENGSLIQLDYSQVELRILAHYANDKKLIQAFIEGRDIHRETTAKCLKKAYDKVTDEERKIIGKRVNFGIVYLISAKGLSEKINCTKKEAEEYIRNWYAEFGKAKKWMENKESEIISTGKSIAFNGRIRRLYGANTDTPEGRELIRQGVNSPIQGGAGDITKFAMYQLDRRLRKEGMESRIIINVHDSIMVDSPKKEVKKCIEIMKEVCKKPPVELRVPLDFEIKCGPNWSELKEVK